MLSWAVFWQSRLYAVILLADNATFSLAVNRMVAFCTQTLQSSATVAQLADLQIRNLEVRNLTWDNVFYMFVPTSTHAVEIDLSSLSLGERATPFLLSLNNLTVKFLERKCQVSGCCLLSIWCRCS